VVRADWTEAEREEMNPAVEYRKVQSQLREVIDRLPLALNNHIARQEQTPSFWCHVADVKHARLEVLRVLAFLGDIEAKEELHAEGGER
jgi:predicted RNA-binding Zn ribbon-like protein